MIRVWKGTSLPLRVCIAWHGLLGEQISRMCKGLERLLLTLLRPAWRTTEGSGLSDVAGRCDHFDIVEAL